MSVGRSGKTHKDSIGRIKHELIGRHLNVLGSGHSDISRGSVVARHIGTIGGTDIDINRHVARNLHRIPRGTAGIASNACRVDKRHVDPCDRGIKQCQRVACGDVVLLIVQRHNDTVAQSRHTKSQSLAHDTVGGTKHLHCPTASVIRRRDILGHTNGAAGESKVVVRMTCSVHHINVVAATKDIVVDTLDRVTGGVPHHISTIVLCIAGILTEHDVQTLTSDSVDGISREPTHTIGSDVFGVVDTASNKGETLGNHFSLGFTKFVDRSMLTSAKAAGIAFRLGVIVTLLNNRTTGPLGSIRCEDHTDAGQIRHIIKIK